MPRLASLHVDLTTLAFAAIASIVSGLFFGLLPARYAARTDPNESLKESGRASSMSASALRLRSALMTVEVALALVLLVGAGLLTRSFAKLVRVDPGVDPTNVVTGWIGLPANRYPNEDRQRLALTDILRRVQAIPGVTSAALTSALPLGGNIQLKRTFEGHPRPKGQEPLVQLQLISPDYFRTMGMRVLAGRSFTESDTHAQHLVWIDEAIARKYFPGENPVGKWIIHGAFDSTEPKEIIAGVVNAVHDSDLGEHATGIIYMSFEQMPQSWMALTVKAGLPADQVVTTAIRRALAAFDKQLPLSNEHTLNSLIERSVGQQRFTLLVLGNFAIVALLLAAVGVYGVISYFVAQRSQEIGIRIALGAQRADVVKLVTRAVLASAGTGVLLGLVVAAAASHLMTQLLYEIEPTDLPTYASAAVALLLVAVLAALVPATRATRVSPAVALKPD